MGNVLKALVATCFYVLLCGFTGNVVGTHYPATTVAGLANYKPPTGTFPTSFVTDATTCVQNGALTGGGAKLCRVGWTGAAWQGISNPVTSNTFSVNNPCHTDNQPPGGCTNNQVSYGAGGSTLPVLNVGNTSVAQCNGTAGDKTILTNAAGSGGTAGNRKGVLIQGTQCDMRNGPFVIPPYTDVQCAQHSTIICNPSNNTALSGQCNPADSTFTGAIASFQVNGPNQGGTGHDVTISNCTFNELNTQPPFYPGCTPTGAGCSPPPGNSFQVLIEHASNITVSNNLFNNTVGQAAVEALGGSGATPDSSNVNFIWNTYNSGALYGATCDNIINCTISHNYYIDARFGNEMDNSGQTGGSYINNYNYIYVHYGVGYYHEWCNGFGGLDAYCTLHALASCTNTGNILDPGNQNGPTCPHLTNEFVNAAGEMTLEGQGGTWSNNYCPNGGSSTKCSCDGVGSGCSTANVPNPAPSGP